MRLQTRNGEVTFTAKARPTAPARAAETKPTPDSGSAPVGAGSEKTPPASSKDSAPGSPAKSEAEPPKPAPHRSLTIALEKEAKLTEERKAFKGEVEAFKAERTQLETDAKAMRDARALTKEGKRLKALELLGMTLDDVQDEYLASVREETPEDKAARIVRDTLAKEREAIAQKARETEEAAARERTVREQASVDWWKGQVEGAYKERHAEYDPAAFIGINADQIWQRACEEMQATGKLPTAAEALDLIQKDFDARLAKSKRYKPAEAPVPKQDSPQAKDTPKTLTTKGAGSVPVTAKKPQQVLTARERAHEAMRELGLK